jgi:periplasmic mercuric ion binding protein
MKKQIITLVSFLFLSIFSFAQATKAKATAPTTEKEKAAKAAGATYALWNEDAKILTVKYAAAKTTNKKIQDKVAAAGYDTQDVTATQEAYNKLPGCCKYERKEEIKKEATE